MAKKRKTLPKNFDEILKTGDIEDLKKVYDQCELDAYSGYDKSTALFFCGIPDELVRWLVEQVVDINYRNHYFKTALHSQAGWGGNVKLFVELGADMNITDLQGDTPLHTAANRFRAQCVQELISLGASISTVNSMKYTPLESALAMCQNMDIIHMLEVAKVFLKTENKISAVMQELVKKIGERFEFYRDSFNKDYLQETDEALNSLYELFLVQPVKKQRKHDGISKITANKASWQEQHNELWQYLVSGSGHAQTVQGEVIRITGRISHEVLDNGGTNWDNDYRKMLKALVSMLSSETALNSEELKEIQMAAKTLNNGLGDDEPARLCELAVKWVLENPEPFKIGKVDYKR